MLLGTMPSSGPRRRHGHLPQVGANSTYGWNSWDCYYSSDVVAYTTDGHAVDVDINWPEGSKTLVLGTMEATTSTTITAIGSIPR